MTAPIERCPETGLWLLPRGDARWTRYLPSWDDLTPALRGLVLPLVEAQAAEDRRSGLPVPERRLLPVTLGLLPQPDNQYDWQAVAVVAPTPGSGVLDPARQVAWIKHDHVRSLQPSIVGLGDATGEPVGFRALCEVNRHQPGIDYDADDDEGDDLDGEVLTAEEAERHGYWYSGLRANIDSWEPVRDAVLAVIVKQVTDRIIPIIDRSAPWLPGTQDIRDRHRQAGRFTIHLLATADALTATVDGTPVAALHPDPRGFFARTHSRVLALGGSATAQAGAHGGSVEIWIEDDRPI